MTSYHLRRLDPPKTSAPCWSEHPRPRPLFWPAVGLMLGIAAAEQLGPLDAVGRTVLLTAPLVPAAILLALAARKRLHTWTRHAWLTLLALLVGAARHQALQWHPGHHLTHALSDEPVLTRLAGTIITEPVERPPRKLNPFLVFEPTAHTQFVLAAEEVRASNEARPVAGHVRVTVEAGALGLRLGQRVQLTGRLYRPRGPRNPGEFDGARWYRHQGLDAGLAVEGAAHVVRLAPGRMSGLKVVGALRDRARTLLFEPLAAFATDDSTRLLEVMVLGQRSAADQRLNEAFLRHAPPGGQRVSCRRAGRCRLVVDPARPAPRAEHLRCRHVVGDGDLRTHR